MQLANTELPECRRDAVRVRVSPGDIVDTVSPGPRRRDLSRKDVDVEKMTDRPVLLCFSHLRWGFVWQRPQHVLSRLAQRFDVWVIEEPEFTATDRAQLRSTTDAGITILTPLLPVDRGYGWGFNQRTNRAIRRLLSEQWTVVRSNGDVVWYYTPMAYGSAPGAFDRALVVYDVMDELKHFRGAPAELSNQEETLFTVADLVYTGGPGLYNQRKGLHPQVHCFPSGVEAAHFAPDRSRALPAECTTWGSPVLGFYGVLDERIDFDLIARVADLRPDWTMVLIGPLAKIQDDELPRRANIIYPGKREYSQLPAYLDQFDIAILPFALNDATAFISPTKTLEYLAAGKPVISTPIRDVIALYGDAVEIASTPEAFVTIAEALLTGDGAARRAEHGRRLVANHSWAGIAAEMSELIETAMAAKNDSAGVLVSV